MVSVVVPVDLTGFRVVLTRSARLETRPVPVGGSQDIADESCLVADVAAFGAQDSLLLSVEVPCTAAGLQPGAVVELVGLIAVPEVHGGHIGVVFYADRVEPGPPVVGPVVGVPLGFGWGGAAGVGSPARRAVGDPTPAGTLSTGADQRAVDLGEGESGCGRGTSRSGAGLITPVARRCAPEVRGRMPTRLAGVFGGGRDERGVRGAGGAVTGQGRGRPGRRW